MLKPTQFKVSQQTLSKVPTDFAVDGKLTINQPTGNFFYDPWEIKPEYKNTVWDELLSALDTPIGEARVIILSSGTGYFQHADIDDRYHFNISGDCAYMIDFDHEEMHRMLFDGVWYEMDAGLLHSAASFGKFNRTQIVVRKLLNRNELAMPVKVTITATGDYPRYDFDYYVSQWLNRANKEGVMNEFSYKGDTVSFYLESSKVDNLRSIVPVYFDLKVEDAN